MYNVRGLTSHINGGTLAAYIPNVSAAIMTPSLYLKAITEVPVTMGSLNTINYALHKGSQLRTVYGYGGGHIVQLSLQGHLS